MAYSRAIVLALGGAALAAAWLWLGIHIRLETLLIHIDDFAGVVRNHAAWAGLIYMLAYAAVVALSVPIALPMTLIGGALFGACAGSVLTAVGATLGAILLFLAARGLFHAYFLRKSGGWLGRLQGGFTADAASYLLLLRLTPIFPFAMVNLAAALLGARVSTYVWTTFVGILPATIAFTLTGAGLGGLLTGEGARLKACHAAGAAECRAILDLHALISRDIILGLAALGLVMVLSLAARRILQRNRTRP